jgi:hypothetical protein
VAGAQAANPTTIKILASVAAMTNGFAKKLFFISHLLLAKGFMIRFDCARLLVLLAKGMPEAQPVSWCAGTGLAALIMSPIWQASKAVNISQTGWLADNESKRDDQHRTAQYL